MKKEQSQELKSLLENIEKESFYGLELSHNPLVITIKYVPEFFVLSNYHADIKEPFTTGIKFDKDYAPLAFYQKTPFSEKEEIYLKQQLQETFTRSMILNCFRRDPRYILRNAADIQYAGKGKYVMRINDDSAKEFEQLAARKDYQGEIFHVKQFAEMHLKKDFLEKLVVKNKWRDREEIFTHIDFYKNENKFLKEAEKLLRRSIVKDIIGKYHDKMK